MGNCTPFAPLVTPLITKPPNKLKATPNTVDLAMDLLLSSQAKKHR